MTTLTDIPDEASFKTTLAETPATALTILYFHAPWAAPCAQMRTILTTLAQTYQVTSPKSIQFLSVDAEALPEISEEYDVTAVPYLVLLRDGKTVETVSGCDAAPVREAVEKHYTVPDAAKSGTNTLPAALSATKRPDGENGHSTGTADLSSYAPSSTDPPTAPAMSGSAKIDQQIETPKEDITARLTSLVKAAPVMLFMKGTPSTPQCGFSRQLVGMLRERSVRYGFFNILADEDVRQGLKTFADWPTFPQLWVDGELVGGLDIVKEELENNPDFFAEYSVNKTATAAS